MHDPISMTFKLPRQDRLKLSLFTATADGVQAWVSELPIMDINRLVDLLLQALDDMNRTSLAPQTRYTLLDALYTSIDEAVTVLAKRFLNQPLIMPSQPKAMAASGNQLCALAAIGYALAAVHAVKERDSIQDTNPARLACQSIQRALLFNSRRILHMLQLHTPMEEGCWELQHQLYALAEYQGLTGLPVPEPLSGSTTIKAAYLQGLLLSCCKPNQLRQSDLTTLHRCFREWGEKVDLNRQETGDEVYLTELDSDKPPQYLALYRGQPTSSCRALDCTQLLKDLDELRQQLDAEEASFDRKTNITGNLLQHVVRTLSSRLMRNFKRTASNSPLWICLGLESIHRQVHSQQIRHQEKIAGSVGHDPFDVQNDPCSTPQAEANIWRSRGSAEQDTQKAGVDPSSGAKVDSAAGHMVQEGENPNVPTREKTAIFEAQLSDASANGYCLEWTDASPGDTRVGDIVAVKEDKKHNDWAIAVIRWLSTRQNSKTLVGLELLSPRALACVASLRRSGTINSQPQRALLLPEIKIVGQSQTLITPRASFKARQQLMLEDNLGIHNVTLLRQLNSTGGFDQFDFQYTEDPGVILSDNSDKQSKVAFDSLWNNI